MKLDIKGTVATQTSGDLKGYSFGVRSEDMGLILDILRSRMYKDPIKSICREICANARDANREAHKNKVPIRVSFDKSIFNINELTISISDDGPGISPDRMGEIYVNYGASTKRETNRYTGAYGLGAKTPFSYTDSFYVATKVDGTRYVYVAAIEENRTGTMYLMSQEATTESNGTSVIIPVKQHDVREFQEAVYYSTYFWDTRPQYLNFSYGINELTCNEYCGVKVATGYSSLYPHDLYILIDQIPYECDTAIVNNFKRASDTTIFLSYKVGEVSISANRESVQFDEHTKARIQRKWNEFQEYISKKIADDLAACEDDLGVFLKWVEIKKTGINTLVSEEFTYKGQKLSDKIIFEKIFLSYVVRGKKDPMLKYTPQMRDLPYIFMDLPQQTASRSLTLTNKYPQGYILVEPKRKDLRQFSKCSFGTRKAMATSMRGLLKEVAWLKANKITAINLSAVEKTIAKRDLSTSSIVLRVASATRDLFRVQKTTQSYIQTHLVKDLYHILNKKDTVKLRIDKEWATYIHSTFNKAVFFITPGIEDVFKTAGIQSMTEFLVSKEKDLTSISDYRLVKKVTGLDFYDRAFTVNGVAASIKMLRKIQSNSQIRCYGMPTDFDTKVKPSPEVAQAVATLENASKKYPLLALLKDSCYEKNEYDHIKHYIQMVDKECENE